MAGSDDSLISFLFYVFIVYPVTGWLLKVCYYRDTSFFFSFSIIVITRSSPTVDIRKAYKKKSLELHPDKNQSPNAAAEFERVKEAYDVRPPLSYFNCFPSSQ